MKQWFKVFIGLSAGVILLSVPTLSSATPTQYGETGLISVPTADVADRGVSHIAVWLNKSAKSGDDFTLLPASLTLGILDSLELYGSYPNLLVNGKNDGSMRGYGDIGIKYRLAGDSTTKFRAALSAFYRQTVSDNKDLSGLKDVGGRLIVSYALNKNLLHLNAGYLKVESPTNASYDDEILFGGALERGVSNRMRIFLELDGNTSRTKGSPRIELSPGVQYHYLPNVSFMGGVGAGLTDIGPDYRVVVGVTFSSGAGSYVAAIPIIPGSREKYAEAQATTTEELVPELPVPTKEAEIKPIVAPTATAVTAPVPVPAAPEPPPAPIAKTAPAVEKIEVAVAGSAKKVEITVEKDKIVVQGDVLFASGKSELTPSGLTVITTVAGRMKEIRGLKGINLEGHTDNVGPDDLNEKLSLKRAQAVKDQLVKSGISASTISVKGYGKSKPIASNDTPEGRDKNRRVDILLIVGEQ